MISETKVSGNIIALIALAAGILVIAGMKSSAEILTPALIALILAIVLSPIQNWLIKKGLSKSVAFVTVLLIVVLMVVGLLGLIGYSVTKLATTLPEYQQDLSRQQESIDSLLENLGISYEYLSSIEAFQPDRILQSTLQITVNTLFRLVNSAVDIGLMLIILAFMLLDSISLKDRIRTIFPKVNPTIRRMESYTKDIQKYLAIATIINLLVGTINMIFLAIMGVPFALLWGFLSFILGYIPSIGFFISLVPPAILAYMLYGFKGVLVVILAYLIINGFVENVLKPKLMGDGLNLSPLVVFLSLIFWGWILGPAGALIAVPMTVFVIRLFLDSGPETKALANLMRAHPEKEEPTSNTPSKED